MTPARSNTATPPDERPTTRNGRPLSHAEEDLRLFAQIDSRWRKLSGPTAQLWVVERMAADCGLTLMDPGA